MHNHQKSCDKLNDLKTSLEKAVRKEFTDILYQEVENPEIKSILGTLERNFQVTNRPMLMALSCEAVGGKIENSIIAGLVVTIAGKGVGIHDDIIDKSMKKKFGNTIPGRYNEQKALLIGDLLIIKGLTSIRGLIRNEIEPQKIADVLKVLHEHYVKICEGVFLEKSCAKSVEATPEICLEIIDKYASDGEACTRIGALLGNGSKKEVRALAEFGKQYCYVYRLAEEVYDLLVFNEDLPRRLKHENLPLPLAYVVEKSTANKKKIKEILEGPLNKLDFKTINKLCFDQGGFKDVFKLAKESVTKGITALDMIRPNQAKDCLRFMLINDTFITRTLAIYGHLQSQL